jgi:hypothetical protein
MESGAIWPTFATTATAAMVQALGFSDGPGTFALRRPVGVPFDTPLAPSLARPFAARFVGPLVSPLT